MGYKPELNQERKRWLNGLKQGDQVLYFRKGLINSEDYKPILHKVRSIEVDTNLIKIKEKSEKAKSVRRCDGCNQMSFITPLTDEFKRLAKIEVDPTVRRDGDLLFIGKGFINLVNVTHCNLDYVSGDNQNQIIFYFKVSVHDITGAFGLPKIPSKNPKDWIMVFNGTVANAIRKCLGYYG